MASLSALDERKKRNTVVYIVQLIFSLFALPAVAKALSRLYQPKAHFDGVDPNAWPLARGFIVAQSVLFLQELFYRLNTRPEVVIHHRLAAALVIFLNWSATETFALDIIVKIGLVLTLMAVTEQPVHLALILRNMGYKQKQWWKWLMYFAGWSFIAVKVVLAALTFTILAQIESENEKSWALQSTSFADWKHNGAQFSARALISITATLVAALLLAQIYAGTVYLKIANNNEDSKAVPPPSQLRNGGAQWESQVTGGSIDDDDNEARSHNIDGCHSIQTSEMPLEEASQIETSGETALGEPR